MVISWDDIADYEPDYEPNYGAGKQVLGQKKAVKLTWLSYASLSTKDQFSMHM